MPEDVNCPSNTTSIHQQTAQKKRLLIYRFHALLKLRSVRLRLDASMKFLKAFSLVFTTRSPETTVLTCKRCISAVPTQQHQAFRPRPFMQCERYASGSAYFLISSCHLCRISRLDYRSTQPKPTGETRDSGYLHHLSLKRPAMLVHLQWLEKSSGSCPGGSLNWHCKVRHQGHI